MNLDKVKITESIEYVTVVVLDDDFTFTKERELTQKVEGWFTANRSNDDCVSVNLLDVDEVRDGRWLVKFEVVTKYGTPIYYMR